MSSKFVLLYQYRLIKIKNKKIKKIIILKQWRLVRASSLRICDNQFAAVNAEFHHSMFLIRTTKEGLMLKDNSMITFRNII